MKQQDAAQNSPEGAITPSDNRRRYERTEIHLKARYLGADGVERFCVVKNISAGGALLEAEETPSENEKIVLYVDQIGRFEATVARVMEGRFAVDYQGRRSKANRTADAIFEAVSREQAGVERRRSPRIKTASSTALVLENGESLECAINDLSLTGASVDVTPAPAIGATVTLGRMKGKVVRRHEKGVVLVFTGSSRGMEGVYRGARGEADARQNASGEASANLSNSRSGVAKGPQDAGG